jgi:hypothetical protein
VGGWQLHPGVQPDPSLQLVVQAVAPQTYGLQPRGAAAGLHSPRPSQTRAGVSVSVLAAHVEAAQVSKTVCSRQPPLPLQPPARPHEPAASAGHWLRGSMPLGTAVHVPTAPATLQAKQLAPHKLVQQTPSTQNPVAHWSLSVQLAATARLTAHLFASQKNPVWH